MAERCRLHCRHRRRRSAAAQGAGRTACARSGRSCRSSPNARTAPARWKRIAEHQPDVAFLDIRMPGLTGLEVAAAAAQASPRTQIVFVTAYDQYAIDAFERGAVDYLLKPIAPRAPGRHRATPAGARRRQRRRCRRAGRAARTPRRALPRSRRAEPLTWITASAGRETRLILVDDVAYFRADNKYTVGDDRRRRSAAAQADPRTAAACSIRTRSSRSTAPPSSTSRRSPPSSATTPARARCA